MSDIPSLEPDPREAELKKRLDKACMDNAMAYVEYHKRLKKDGESAKFTREVVSGVLSRINPGNTGTSGSEK